MKLPMWLGHASAFVVSLTAGFFLVLNVLFSDVLSLRDQIQAVVTVLVTYTVLGFLFSRLWRNHARAWAIWLMTPPGVLVALLLVSEQSFDWYSGAVLAAFIIGTTIGTGVFFTRQVTPPSPVGGGQPQ